MAQPLIPRSETEGSDPRSSQTDAQSSEEMSDLRIFWGPEICRLEYLLHLVDTGRVKDDSFARSA